MTFLVVAGFVLSLIFFLLMLTVPWWSTPPGIATFVFSAVVLVVLGLRASRVVGFEFAGHFGTAVFVIIDLAILGEIIGFLSVRRRSYNRSRRSDSSSDERTGVS